MKSQCVTIQMKATEQYFPVVLFIMMCKVVLTFDPVEKFNHSDEYKTKDCHLPYLPPGVPVRFLSPRKACVVRGRFSRALLRTPLWPTP